MPVLRPSGTAPAREGFASNSGSRCVTMPLGGTGAVKGLEAAANFLWRMPVVLPVTTIRWRLRMRNFNCNTVETAGSNMTLLSCWLGKPKFNAGRWKGAFQANTLRQIFGKYPIAGANDTFTEWVTERGNQIIAYEPVALSLAFEKGAATQWFFDEFGAVLCGGEAGNVSNPAVPGSITVGSGFDLRLEYEYVPTNLTPGSVGNQYGFVAGDSIVGGYALNDGGTYCYEGFAAVAGLRQGHPIAWTGPAGAKTSEMLSLASWRYARLNLGTGTAEQGSAVPTYGIISLGINDTGVITLAEYEANINSIVEKMMGELKIPQVYIATSVPFEAAAGRETARQEFNKFIRSMPCGIQGVVDLDAQLRQQAAPQLIEAIWGPNSEANPHVNRQAYQRMAGALILP